MIPRVLRRVAGVLVLILVPAALGAQGSFPHERHVELVPSCEGCHAGVTSGDTAALFPDPALCATCHDGSMAPEVEWKGPSPGAVSARFPHDPRAVKCETCHLSPGAGEPAAAGAERRRVGPPAAPTWHGAGFDTEHGAAAAVGQPTCSSCHSDDFCTACHEGSAAPGFHPANFLVRHGPEAFGRLSDCSSCHSTEAFCRECHVATGVGGEGRLDTPGHDRQPIWLLNHGQAARQDLESCVSCHRQTDCLQCHSTVGGLGVNPHGSEFDPTRMSDRNRLTCRICHVSDPLGGS